METKTVNGVTYYRDWDKSEGGIRMVSPKTIGRYLELKSERPKSENYGIFFAFNNEQFEEGRKRLIDKGYLKDGETLCSAGAGTYGTKTEIDRFMKFYEEREAVMKKECNPQEVYFYEWNDHECMFGGDDAAMKIVISVFGKKAAHTIHRVCADTPTNILAPLTKRDKHLGEYEHELMMLGRLSFDCRGFFSEGDCRHYRPDCLWGGSVKRQVEEMRKLYSMLPDDIKDASFMTEQDIEDYASRFEAWADEEFSKPQYDPVERTPYEQYHDLQIILRENLWYKDDEGKWQHPSHVWFSGDTRRCHQDARCVNGRAYTSYLGKNGTSLARVHVTASDSLAFVPYTRKDLCDVTARFDSAPLKYRLYDFHRE